MGDPLGRQGVESLRGDGGRGGDNSFASPISATDAGYSGNRFNMLGLLVFCKRFQIFLIFFFQFCYFQKKTIFNIITPPFKYAKLIL